MEKTEFRALALDGHVIDCSVVISEDLITSHRHIESVDSSNLANCRRFLFSKHLATDKTTEFKERLVSTYPFTIIFIMQPYNYIFPQ